jgi:hypothetical protein
MIMFEVQLGKEKYSSQSLMESWCSENVGANAPYRNWVEDKPESWEGLGNWCMSSMFGNTFFYFRNEADAMKFEKFWK